MISPEFNERIYKSIVFEHPDRLVEPDSWVGHIPFAFWIVESLRPNVIVELGTHSGNSYCAFCQAVKTLEYPVRCYAVDTWKGDAHASFYGEAVFSELKLYHELRYADFSRLIRSTFDEALQYFSDNSIDLLHIDGCHTYEAVSHDFTTWLPKLSSRGIVLFHDINVRDADFGVWRFWEEISLKYPHFSFLNSHGLGILGVGNSLPESINWLFRMSKNSDQTIRIRNFFSKIGGLLRDRLMKETQAKTIELHEVNIHNLNNNIDNLINEIDRLNQDIEKQRQDIQTQQATIDQLKQANAGLQNELTAIYDSKAWRLVSILRKIKYQIESFWISARRLCRFNNLIRLLKKTKLFVTHFGVVFTVKKILDYCRITEFNQEYTGDTEHDFQAYSACSYEQEKKYVLSGQNDLKLIAFYLPQFHPIPENDLWWGKGFTEWTNVSKATPQYEGHYQPKLPGELGFYDLRIKENQKRQIELAKQYGIYGFCFYHYWFSGGKRLLERPVNQLLADPGLDMPFCLCWANENWTRRWDGLEHEVLIAQKHSPEEDWVFIKDLEPILRDKRYIKINDKPLLIVYRVDILPDAKATAKRWREYCRNVGIGDLFLVAAQSFGIIDPTPYGFDATVEFPPHAHLQNPPQNSFVNSKKRHNPDFVGNLFEFEDLINCYTSKKNSAHIHFKTVSPSWDNTARRKNKATIYVNSSPNLYQKWLKKACDHTLENNPPDKRLVFINAWNEWAEGAYLEPDAYYGYAYLNKTADVLQKYSFPKYHSCRILFISHDAQRAGAQILLLNLLRWIKKNTAIEIKILLISGGPLTDEFKEIGDAFLLDDLLERFGEDRLWAKLEELCEGKIDLIYGNTCVSGVVYRYFKDLNIPIITHIHELEESIKKFAGEEVFEEVIRQTQHYIAASPAITKNLVSTHSINRQHISTVNAFIEPDDKLFSQTKEEIRNSLKLAQDAFLVFGCGSMDWRKGPDLFFDVAECLSKKGIDNFHFYWIGSLDDHFFDLSKKLSSTSAKKHVTVLGVKTNPRAYFRAGDLFLLTSREDPFPLVCLEAAECKLPLICFEKSGGMPDFVKNEIGFTVPFEDTSEMANKIEYLMSNKEVCTKLGIKAREKLLATHITENEAPKIVSVCQNILKIKPKVSVVVPNYNYARYLPKRLDTIFDQTFKDFEVIILDDNSNDNSLEIINRYAYKLNVRIYKNQNNSGNVFKQWVKGIKLAHGDIIWIAEADDFSSPYFLETLLPSFDNPDTALAYCHSNVIDESGNVLPNSDYRDIYLNDISTSKWNNDYQESGLQEINQCLAIKNTIPNVSAVLFRKKDFVDIEQRIINCKFGGDWLFYLFLLKSGDISYSSIPLNYHRRHAKSVVANSVKSPDILLSEFNNIHKYILDNFEINSSTIKRMIEYVSKEIRGIYQELSDQDFAKFYKIPNYVQKRN